MRKVVGLLVTFITFAVCESIANDSCRILFNKQVIYKGEVDRADAVAMISAPVIHNTDQMTIVYHTENGNKGWRRTFYLEDSAGENIKTVELGKGDGIVIFNASALSSSKQKRRPILIYTMSLPTDKKLAARIRVRRVFICKIAWN